MLWHLLGECTFTLWHCHDCFVFLSLVQWRNARLLNGWFHCTCDDHKYLICALCQVWWCNLEKTTQSLIFKLLDLKTREWKVWSLWVGVGFCTLSVHKPWHWFCLYVDRLHLHLQMSSVAPWLRERDSDLPLASSLHLTQVLCWLLCTLHWHCLTADNDWETYQKLDLYKVWSQWSVYALVFLLPVHIIHHRGHHYFFTDVWDLIDMRGLLWYF